MRVKIVCKIVHRLHTCVGGPKTYFVKIVLPTLSDKQVKHKFWALLLTASFISDAYQSFA